MAKEKQKPEELTIKFGKGLAEDFKGKDGKEYKRILIPNKDPSDHTPWASFVLPARAVHENKYGKGLWAKIPADGLTVVTKPSRTNNSDGTVLWNNQQNTIPNKKLKEMVEAYKTKTPQGKASATRESAKKELDTLVKETAARLSANANRSRPISKGPER